ncbi:AAA domain-containing protein [Methylosinus sp. sav-2]|uniref:ATP-binding protein n=1 Tax=Methylosinus sp. sav-2 TaxID=2485168 RepID=UPI00047ED7A5|nr:ATP-binding protein [Methylosinus sp. sav-2]TDX60783.1 AAA domain-containing protein [Methylosinus sp. sav-2]
MKRAVQTTIYKAIEDFVSYAMMTGQAVSIKGPPGIGKTFALKYLAAKIPGAKYIELATASGSMNPATRLICDHLDIRGGQQHCGTMWRSLETYFEQELRYRDDELESKRTVIFLDEAQYLKLNILKDILSLSENYKATFVLCGNRSLLKRTQAVDADAFGQMGRRVARQLELTPPEDEDFESIAVDFDVSGKEAYRACVAFGRATNSIGELVRMLNDARLQVGDGPLTIDEIKAAAAVGKFGLKALKTASLAR